MYGSYQKRGYSRQLCDRLPEGNIFAPENEWLEEECFLLGWPIFRDENVSLKECDWDLPRIPGLQSLK